jgi:hypothetical protein
VLGKHSGRHALASHLHHLGYDLTKQEVDELFKRFKVGPWQRMHCVELGSCIVSATPQHVGKAGVMVSRDLRVFSEDCMSDPCTLQ